MARWLLLIIPMAALVLSACAPQVDRCTADPNLPDCRANQAVAQSTIAAANADTDARVRQAYMKATQDAVALHAQATQGAINTRATAEVVSANATRVAMENNALRDSLALTATLQAAQFTIITTRTALEGDARINALNVQAGTAALGQVALFASALSVIVALAIYLVWYSRRVAASIANAAEIRSGLIYYGPNRQHLALFTQGKNGSKRVLLIDEMIGSNGNTADDAQRLSSSDDAAVPQLAAPQVEGAMTATRIPTFAELLRDWQPTQDRLLFGYGEAGPLYGRIDQLLSVEIIGRQGQGKTTLLRLIYAQCLMVGVQVLVWDLHEDIVEDLPGAQTYTTAETIMQSALALQAELDRRIAEHDKTNTPIMALIDEINQLVNVAPAVAQVIGRVVNEGRKYRIFCIVSAKGIPATLFGGSTVRDAFSSRFAFNTTTRQAAMIGFDREVVPVVRNLTPGRALFEGPVPAQIITVPNATPADVKNILAVATPLTSRVSAISAVSTETPSARSETRLETATETQPDGVETNPETAQKRRQVRDLLRRQTPITKIIKAVWGVSTGRAYQQASREFVRIASELVK